MSLESGLYFITSFAGDAPVGRNSNEDMSLQPKRVSIQDKSSDVNPWTIEKAPDRGTYTLKTNGAPVAEFDGQLFAVLGTETPATEWRLTPDELKGRGAYIIEKADRSGEGWVVPSEGSSTQVMVRPLIVSMSLPPFYPSNEVFKIVKA